MRFVSGDFIWEWRRLGVFAIETAEVSAMLGFFETATEITITERTFKQAIHKRQKYKVKNKVTKKETIVTAKYPVKLLPECKYCVDFALSIVAGKFLKYLPYDRQRKELNRFGLRITTMTRILRGIILDEKEKSNPTECAA